MRILVTGGAGFIASHIVDAYIEDGHDVIVIDNLSTGKRENLNKKAKFYEADIRDKRIEDIFKSEKIDIVNHHAAQIDVRKSVSNPIFDADVNIIGTLNLLENSRKYSVKKFIFASSGGVMYGECERNPKEDDPALPLSPYGISKKVVEDYLRFYRYAYNLDYTVFRYGNVYGPRQDPHGEAGVVAIFSKAMLNNEDVFIFGDGEQLRDYVYVEDIVRANLIALSKGDGEVFNLGTGVSISVNELFKYLKEITGYKKEAIYKPPRLGELQKSKLNVKKAEEMLNWKAETTLREGLEKTVEYFKCNV
ncbi:MAG: UDP-glucose 4-epimerase [Caldiserica bacterium]|nr:MAG: UDP-glucose 4-epimerase [Caldisericota bacterium]